MNILITGGTGFIGSALCEKLRTQQHKLTVYSRQDAASVQNICGVDIESLASLTELSGERQFDVIINLAGEPIAAKRWSDARKRQLLDSRVGTTQDLIDYIRRAAVKPQCLISGSAIGWYGNQSDLEISENSSPHDEFSHQLCAQWEAVANQSTELGVRTCILRTGLVVGRGGGFLAQMLLPFKLGLGGPIGDGKQWMSWVHLEDLLKLIIWLLDNPSCNGVYNGTAPNPVTNRAFAQTLAKCLHRFAVLPAPAFALRMALGEMSELLLTGQKVIPGRAVEQGFRFEYEELETALRQVLG